MYAQVVVNIPDIRHQGFDYLIPESLLSIVSIGSRVMVPLANREVLGYVIALKAETEITNVKPIASCLDLEPTLNEEMVKLALWMGSYYSSHLYTVLQLLAPTALKTKQKAEHKQIKFIELLVSRNELLTVRAELPSNAVRQHAVIDYFLMKEIREVKQATLLKELNIASTSLKALVKRGLFQIVERDQEFILTENLRDKRVTLTGSQENVLEQLLDMAKTEKSQTALIHGVTGSGKTEIYIELIEKMLTDGHSAILLVPEIALTTQMIARFRGRFRELVAVLHSRLTPTERLQEWLRIRSGEARIVIGARSAIFAPALNLGLIIIDEEHETSYKQEEHPRYHTRDIAKWRIVENNALLLLGSATPSLESYHAALSGEYQLLELAQRIGKSKLPEVEVVDMSNELKAGNRLMFSRSLMQELEGCLDRGEQAIIFLNRRGYSTFVSCRSCGYVVKCPHCDISLTYHRTNNVLRCHYCGYTVQNPTTCPECKSTYIRFFGTGTQKVEDELRRLLPKARIARMDSDNTTRKGAHEKILSTFRVGETDILLGTQMVAKGLDFANVSLVGVVAADTILALPDFRAAERTFQLLTQVSGRAGRHHVAGRVVVQTYSPEHYSIRYAQKHDYIGFYHEESKLRKQMNYPPFSKLVLVSFSHTNIKQVILAGNYFVKRLRAGVSLETSVPDPVSSPISRIKDRNRMQTMIKYQERETTIKIINEVLIEVIEELKDRDLQITIDIDPYMLL